MAYVPNCKYDIFVSYANGGYTRFTKTYDKFGNATETAYFAEDGKPVVGKDGYAVFRQRYDEHCRITAQAYYGADGKPVVSKEGYAVLRQTYDEHGKLLDQSYYDADGKPRRQSEGYARLTMAYDSQGQQTAESFYDETGAPTATADGIARTVIQYGYGGKPIISAEGAHGEVLEPHIRVVSIVPSSQAEHLKLQAGDVVERYAGREVKAMEELQAATREPGDAPRELIMRRGKALLKFQAQPGRIGIEMRTIYEPGPAQKPSLPRIGGALMPCLGDEPLPKGCVRSGQPPDWQYQAASRILRGKSKSHD